MTELGKEFFASKERCNCFSIFWNAIDITCDLIRQHIYNVITFYTNMVRLVILFISLLLLMVQLSYNIFLTEKFQYEAGFLYNNRLSLCALPPLKLCTRLFWNRLYTRGKWIKNSWILSYKGILIATVCIKIAKFPKLIGHGRMQVFKRICCMANLVSPCGCLVTF